MQQIRKDTRVAQSDAIDKGRRLPAGMRSTALYAGEATAVTAHAPTLRAAAKPHDDAVPTASFLDDLKDKLELRSVMPQRKAEAEQELATGEQHEKEAVNYRYAEHATQSCGECQHFLAPGSCEIVAGLIRPVDVCDMFEPLGSDLPLGVVPSTFVADGLTEQRANGSWRGAGQGGIVRGRSYMPDVPSYMLPSSSYMDYGDYGDAPGFEPILDEWPDTTPTGLNPWLWDAPEEAEVAPPGFEPVVKALKRKPGIENPWAVAWAMRNKGAQPKASETVVQAELAERGDRVVLAEMVTMSSWGASQGPSAPSTIDMVTQPAGKDTAEPAEPIA